MIVIFRPNGTPLFGYLTHNGEHIDSYTVSTGQSGNNVYNYTVDDAPVSSPYEPTPYGLEVGDDSQRTAELMGDDILTLRFSLAENTAFPLRSWCEFDGKRYYLYKSPEITKQHNRNFEYVMPMYTSDYMLKITMMRNRTYNRSTGVFGGDMRLKFPLTATPREHLEMVAACIQDAETETNAVWAVDYSKTMGMTAAINGSHTNYDGTEWNDGGDEELVSYEFVYCIDAIKAAATAFGTEFEIEDAVMTSGGTTTVYHLLSLHDVEYNKETPLYMSYGKGNGFKSGIARKNESDLPPVDRLYIQGGEQNIPQNYGRTPKGLSNGVMTWDGDRSETLLLPRWLTNTNNGIPTSSSVFKGVACIYDGSNFYFILNPTVVTDQTTHERYISAKNMNEYGEGGRTHIPDIIYDSNGDVIDYSLPVPSQCFLVSDDGRSVERVRYANHSDEVLNGLDPYYSPRGTKVEAFHDASEVYPMRIGGVSNVQTVTRTRQVDDGNGGTTTETYKLYDIIDALADCPDYSQCSIAGETMTVIFQDGMLAGREFELNTDSSGNVICEQVTVTDRQNNRINARRMELCPSDQDGVTMPNDTFAPAVGDHYIVFHCSLPKAYIGSSVADGNGSYNGAQGIAYGAEFRALKEMVKYLYDNGKETFTFSGSVDTIWAKSVWNEYVERYTESPYSMNIPHSEYFAIGQHIKVTDVQLFGSSGLVMRVTGIKKPVNSPRSIDLTLSNAIKPKFDWAKQLYATVKEVRTRPKMLRPDILFFPRFKKFVRTDDEIRVLKGASNSQNVSITEHATAIGTLQTASTEHGNDIETAIATINDAIASLGSAQTNLRTIQTNFNALLSELSGDYTVSDMYIGRSCEGNVCTTVDIDIDVPPTIN